MPHARRRWGRAAGPTCTRAMAGRASPRGWKRSMMNCKRRIRTGMRDQITPLLITYNEAPNIARTVDKLSWAKRIVVIDSGSTDATLDLLRGFPQVDVIGHPFSDFASQCNFGLTQVATPWRSEE